MKQITYVIHCEEHGNIIGTCSIMVDDDVDTERAVEKDYLQVLEDSLWWEIIREEKV